MMSVRLLADDLTGALDTAGRVRRPDRPGGRPRGPPADPASLPASAALDLGTREASRSIACAPPVTAATPALTYRRHRLQEDRQPAAWPDPARAGRLLRRRPMEPLRPGAGLPLPGPHHSRQPAIHGVQRQLGPRWPRANRRPPSPRSAGPTLLARRPSSRASPCSTPKQTRIWTPPSAAAGGTAAKLLWCGTGGLAGALAGHVQPPPPDLPRPILGLFGSDQPATAAQLAACAPPLAGVAGRQRAGRRPARPRPGPPRPRSGQPRHAPGHPARRRRRPDSTKYSAPPSTTCQNPAP